MAIIRITKEFSFEMAHALSSYDGPCRNIHGHSYRLWVTVAGEPESQKGHPKEGMVLDFSVLKKTIKKNIIEAVDHSLLVSKDASANGMKELGSMFGNLKVVDFEPTCEKLLIDFAKQIKELLPAPTKLHSLKLSETATSYAEWYASDNE